MKKKNVYILGAGSSGLAAAILAKLTGYNPFVSDCSLIKPEVKHILEINNIPYEEGEHKINPNNFDFIIKSPGISPTVPVLKNVKVPIISEIEFASWFVDSSKIIAITGTNGKTTTTDLITHILNVGGYKAIACGNIGYPFSLAVVEHYDTDYFVVEVSSYQLENVVKFHPHIAVITNIAPDHLERYNNSFHKYALTKIQITKNMKEDDYLIYNYDCINTFYYVKLNGIRAKKLGFSLFKDNNDIAAYIEEIGNQIYIIMKKKSKKVQLPLENKDLKRGPNKFNSLAGSILGNLANFRRKELREAFTTFNVRPHRLEEVANINGIRFVNDSKATNINALWYALQETEAPIILLAGGQDKNDDLAPIVELIKEKVSLLILIGKDNTRFRRELQKYTHVIENSNMEQAVLIAYKHATPGTTILLSPGAASWDLYDNYEERGEAFRNAVIKAIEKVKK